MDSRLEDFRNYFADTSLKWKEVFNAWSPKEKATINILDSGGVVLTAAMGTGVIDRTSLMV